MLWGWPVWIGWSQAKNTRPSVHCGTAPSIASTHLWQVAAGAPNGTQVMHHAWLALNSSWPQRPVVTRAACDEVRFVAAAGSGPVPGLLDGEPPLLDGEAVILFDPACGLVMAA